MEVLPSPLPDGRRSGGDEGLGSRLPVWRYCNHSDDHSQFGGIDDHSQFGGIAEGITSAVSTVTIM